MHRQLENLEWEDFCIPVGISGISGYDPEYPFISYTKHIFQENFSHSFYSLTISRKQSCMEKRTEA